MPVDYGIAGMGRYAPKVKTASRVTRGGTIARTPVVKTAVQANAGMAHALWMGVNAPGAGKNREGKGLRMPKSATPRKTTTSVPNFQGQAYKSSYNTLTRLGRRPGKGIVQPISNAIGNIRVPRVSLPNPARLVEQYNPTNRIWSEAISNPLRDAFSGNTKKRWGK